MMSKYRKFPIFVKFNNVFFYEIWIDPHYEKGHRYSINDQLILELIRSTYYWDVNWEARVKGYDYFKVNIYYNLKSYRLIIVLPPDLNYIGVRSAFRVKGFKHEKKES